ncbi:MAG TPA: penicillin-binding protein 2 [Solirubrobacteraceae bacterium]|nr:penicillin-binding protein 2 [Solirubrobacteraceae bacterium]
MAVVQRRVGVIFGLFFVLLVIAAGRTVYLGVLRGPALRKAASSEQLSYEAVIAPRGTITDRNGVDLAVSEPAQDISADPYLIEKPLEDAHLLAPLLGQTQASVLTALSRRTGFVYLARALPEAQARKVLALKVAGPDGTPVKMAGINGTPTMRRVYPRGTLAAQVLGEVGTEGTGLFGLEYSSNAVLSGRSGQRRVVSDALGQPVSISEPRREVAGRSLTLTLDANIQQRAEDVLGAVAQVYHPANATAIVMDPRTGAILALANWPQVDANDPSVSPEEDMEDRAVGLDYEPGSTFKVVAISGALEAGLITPSTTFNIPDEIQVAEKTIHDDTEHPEEMLTAGQILSRSSNVGAITIAKLEGAETFNKWVHRYGFGASTGVDLPGEETGVTLAPDHYSGSSMGNLPIGQGELVTPMQMATAYAAIANGGILRPPHIVRAVGGRALAQPAGHRIISTTTAAELRQMLEGVLGPEGTASEVSIPGYQLAGKTGTANKINPETGEYSESKFMASFIGFAPASDPKLLCAVVVDEPQSGSIYGGTVAAPAFGQIMSFALQYLGIPPG